MGFVGNLLGGGSVDQVAAPTLDDTANSNYVRSLQAQGNNLNQYANNGAQALTAGQQQNYITQLNQQAQGNGPSVARALMNNAMQTNAANTNAAAAAQHGANAALAQRNALLANQQANQQAAATGMIGANQEQLNAQNLIGSNLANMRSQDIQNSMGFNQLNQGYQGLANQAVGNAMNAQTQTNQTNMEAQKANQAASGGLFGGLVSGVGTALTGSGLLGGGLQKAATAVFDNKANHYAGGFIPGRNQVPGDSPRNDTVPAMLSPGEIVVPRSQSDTKTEARDFINHLFSSKSKKQEVDTKGYGTLLKKNAEISRRLALIEKKLSGRRKK
jgi:hypothetical protein